MARKSKVHEGKSQKCQGTTNYLCSDAWLTRQIESALSSPLKERKPLAVYPSAGTIHQNQRKGRRNVQFQPEYEPWPL